MPQWMIIALRLTGLGWFIALCIILGIVGGLWLGNLTGQRALLVLLGAVLGSGIAFYGVYRMAAPAIYGSGGRGSGNRGSGGGRRAQSSGVVPDATATPDPQSSGAASDAESDTMGATGSRDA